MVEGRGLFISDIFCYCFLLFRFFKSIQDGSLFFLKCFFIPFLIVNPDQIVGILVFFFLILVLASIFIFPIFYFMPFSYVFHYFYHVLKNRLVLFVNSGVRVRRAAEASTLTSLSILPTRSSN